MSRLLLTVALAAGLALAACSRGAAPPAGGECTLDTALVAGVPGSPGHLLPSKTNPNGASELAVLMQTFVTDLRAARSAVSEGRPVPPMWETHRRMRCAWPTEPADRSGAYDIRAIAYLGAVKALDSKPADPKAAYRQVVAACRSCHQVMCPGPMAAIDTLDLAP